MSRINYARPFTENVKGVLKARFRLDPAGNPVCELNDDGDKVFTIDLSLEAPTAKTIDSVSYFMDDPTYSHDPEAVSIDRDNDFTEEIESYGNFEVVVTVQIGRHIYKQRAWLSNLLEAGHETDMTPAIRQAIEYIENH